MFFAADALGPDVPGAHRAWHPPAAVPVRARRRDRRAAAARARVEWSARIEALDDELDDELARRRDGYRKAALAHLVLLLAGVPRLAAHVAGDLRENREPLLAEVSR